MTTMPVGRRGDDGHPWPGTTTGLLALIGHPVAHSLSPIMHNAALAVAGLDLVYVAFDIAPAALDAALSGLAALGIVGANVTVPHKRVAMDACAHLSDEARAVGAVNTLTVTAEGLVGDNTDRVGFSGGLPDNVDFDRAVVFGAGGAARAVVVALARRDVVVTVIARRPDALAELVTLAARAGGSATGVGLAQVDLVAAAVGRASLVVNTTPLGLNREPLPAPFMRLRAGQVAYDLHYNPADTPFLVAAEQAGARAIDGLPMLIGQAAASMELWTGQPVDRAVMLTAARSALSVGSS